MAKQASDSAALAQGKDRQFVTALARGLDILRCFSATSPELGTSEIGRLIGLPQPTVWRLCHTLIKLGFLVRVSGTDRLRPDISVLGLGYSAIAAEPVSEIARPHMQAIASRHQGAVSLGARDGLNMIYLQRCQGSSIILADLRVGSRVPLATSATGWAYMAGLPDQARASLIHELRAAPNAGWSRIEPKFDAALRQFKRTGTIVNLGSLHEQINAVAVPIVARDGTVLSLSSGGIKQIFNEQTLRAVGAELLELARKLALPLGLATTH